MSFNEPRYLFKKEKKKYKEMQLNITYMDLLHAAFISKENNINISSDF